MEGRRRAHWQLVLAVLSANDGTAGGAIQALTEEGLSIPVVGQDAELVACQRIAAVKLSRGRPLVAAKAVALDE